MKKAFALSMLSVLCSLVFAQKYERTDIGLKTTIESTNIEIQFYSPDIVRVIKYPAEKPFHKESLSVIKQPEKAQLSHVLENNVLQIKSSSLSVNIHLLTGNITFQAKKGDRPLLTEKEFSTHSQTFLLDDKEPIYGLGQQQDGILNRRGHSFLLRQENMKIAIPFFQSLKGYGVFWDNYSAIHFTDDSNGTTLSSEESEGIDYYFMYGKSMDGVIACMRDLTGQVPLYPLWAWGYWQSKERYTSQKELTGIVQQYRDLQVPLDGIIQDWQYWSTNNAYWNGIEFGNPEYPEPVRMVEDIHNLNAHVIISVWPSFGKETKPYQVFKEKGFLLDMESFPQSDSVRVYNAYNSEARAIYWDFMNKYLFSIGIDGWWLDATEPEYSNITESQLNQPTGIGTFGSVRNVFPLQSIKGIYEHQRKVSDNKRVYILTRSAFAGQQHYASNSWSGDIHGTWETFRKQIPAGLNFSASALPYWNTDIGGFFVGDERSEYADYRELYVRWLQFGAFSPMMRSHGAQTPREIWQFGQKGDWAYDAIEKFIRLRYRLLPYHYSLSWEVTANAGSVIRMLPACFPNDEKVWDRGDEYLYGQSFLVVPVTQAFYAKGEKAEAKADFSTTQTYPVYLPLGTDWYDFWTEEKIKGGTSLQRETPIDLMPLYVKAGSIIPVGQEVQYATEKNWENLELRIYPGADAEFVLYEDEKDNYNYEKGNYSTIKIVWNDSARKLSIEDRRGEFSGMLKERTFHLIVVGQEKETTIQYKGKATTIKLK
jgi:alpha-D-xyloside xylohydrolase